MMKLTPREKQVAGLVTFGLSDEEISKVIGWKGKNARRVLQSIYEKAIPSDVRSKRALLAAKVMRKEFDG